MPWRDWIVGRRPSIVGLLAGGGSQFGAEHGVRLAVAGEPELARDARVVAGLEARGEAGQCILRLLHGRLGLLREERQHRLGEARQVPQRDRRLVAIGITTACIDRAEDGGGIIGIEEGAGTVIDGFAGDRDIVGVHHAMDEADQEPAHHQIRLHRDHRLEQAEIAVLRLRRLRMVARNDMVRQRPQALGVLPGREELEGADADVAGGDARQHRAGQDLVAHHRRPGQHEGERPRRRDAERRHRLADDVFAHHRPDGGAPVPAARIARAAGALELNVAAPSGAIDHLPEQDRPSVAELGHEVAELVAGIGGRDRRRALGHCVAREHGEALRPRKPDRIEPEFIRQPVIQPHQSRLRHGCRWSQREEALRQPGIGIIEGDGHGVSCFGASRPLVEKPDRERGFPPWRPSHTPASESATLRIWPRID